MSGRRQKGFTLLEIMIAVAILAVISALLLGTFSQTTELKRRVEARQDRVSQVRTALSRMVRDLSMAYFSDHEDPTIADRRTRFVSRNSGRQLGELTFSYMGHERLVENSRESDTALVSYFLGSDPNDRRRTNLYRRETRRLQAIDARQIPGETYVVCENVSRLKLRFYDRVRKEWRDEWSTLSADGEQYLPFRTRIELAVLDERGREWQLVTEAPTMLRERIGWFP